METDPTRMCALLVGLPDVTVVGVGEWPGWLRIVIATALAPRRACCGVVAHRHGVREVELVDLPVFGRPARLVWRKQRWRCPTCRRAWTEQDPRIASSAVCDDDPGGAVGDGAGRPPRPHRRRGGRRSRL